MIIFEQAQDVIGKNAAEFTASQGASGERIEKSEKSILGKAMSKAKRVLSSLNQNPRILKDMWLSCKKNVRTPYCIHLVQAISIYYPQSISAPAVEEPPLSPPQ